MRRSVATLRAMAAEPDPILAPKEPATRRAALDREGHRGARDGGAVPDHARQRHRALPHQLLLRLHRGVLDRADGRGDMLGASYATAADRQIRITWFADLLPPQGRRIAEMLATLATIAMFGLLIVLGGKVVWDEYRFEVTSRASASRSGSIRWRCRCSRPRSSGAPSGTASASGAAAGRPSTSHRAVVRRRCSLSRSLPLSRPVRARGAGRGRARPRRHARDLARRPQRPRDADERLHRHRQVPAARRADVRAGRRDLRPLRRGAAPRQFHAGADRPQGRRARRRRR